MEEHKTVLSHLSNDQIKESINLMIQTDKEYDDINFADPSIKIREIGIYMMNLTNENYLNEVLEKIQSSGLVEYQFLLSDSHR